MVDTALVERARAGDKESFADLYEQVSGELYRMALYTLGNPHDAQDAVSETFIEAYKGISSLRDSGAFRAWIARILSIRCKRHIGKYVKDRGCMDIDDILDLADGGDVTEDGINRADLLAAMNRLTPAEREIIVLAVLQGYTTREVAQIVGAPHGTVSSKLHRALKKLRLYLE